MTVYRKDYQESAFLIPQATLSFDLGLAETRVHSRLSIVRNPNVPKQTTLRLQGEGLRLVSVKLNEAVMDEKDYQIEGEDLLITLTSDENRLEISNIIYPEKNTALSGLYASNKKLLTQCEAEGFRRITYFLDRPDVLTQFDVKLSAPKSEFLFMLSNGDLISDEVKNGIRTTHWHDPFPKSCHLFALVAGDFHVDESEYLTQSKKKVALKIFVEPENKGKTHHAMQSLIDAMKFDEVAYGREYDLKNYFIVASNDFNMGAMENKGLNIFNAKYILADESIATDLDYQNITRVVAHEYFHNWRGNRVSPRSWFELSYKEGFTVFTEQDFCEHQFDPTLIRMGEVKLLMSEQFREDQGPLAHPVRPDSYEKIDNFYTKTIYEKGSEVIRMMRLLVGEGVFKQAVNTFFTKFDGKNVSIDEFVDTIQQVSGRDLTQFRLWYSEAGTPHVTLLRQYDESKKQLKLTFTQSWSKNVLSDRKPTMLIPIGFKIINDTKPHAEELIVLDEKQKTFVYEGISKQATVSLLRNFSAPVTLQHDLTLHELALLASQDDDPFNRAMSLKTLLIEWVQGLIQKEANGPIEEAALSALSAILADAQLSKGMRAMLLTLPSVSECTLSRTPYDPLLVIAAIDSVEQKIAHVFKKEFENCVQHYSLAMDNDLSQQAVGERMCYAVALRYLASIANGKESESWFALLKQTHNQTNAENLFRAILKTRTPIADAAIQFIGEKWATHPLLFNKWLSYQAERNNVNADDIRVLATHPQFSLKNPNNVYALYSVFGMRNIRGFHHDNRQGYQLMAEIILSLDTVNPQVAARLIECFGIKDMLVEPFKGNIQTVLKGLQAKITAPQLKELLAKLC